MRTRLKTGILIASSSNRFIKQGIKSTLYIYKEGIINTKILKIIKR